MALYSELKKDLEVLPIYEILVQYYPKKRYWTNLSGLYDGNVENRDVVRVGNFNVVSDGQYLTYSPSRGAYSELPSQPAGRYTSTTSDILSEDSFPVQFAVDPTGPQGGSLLQSRCW